MTATHLHDVAEQLLARAKDALDQPGAHGAPARRYVTINEPVIELGACEQLTVHALPLIKPQPLFSQQRPTVRPCIVSPMTTLVITLARCVATNDDAGNPPDPTVIDAEARALLDDAWVLWSYITRLWATNSLVPDLPCNQVAFMPMTPVGPQGGMAGLRWPIDVQLTASEEAGT